MRNIILVGLLVISISSLGRDHEFRERMELKEIGKENKEYQDRMSKMTPEEYNIAKERLDNEREENIKRYSAYHEELKNMDRGSEKR